MRLLAVVALVVLATPGLAHGSTATVFVPTDGGTLFHYTAEPGEMNQVEASIAAGTVTIRDTGASITAGDGCVSVDAHEVNCDLGINDFLGMTLGDLDDSLTLLGEGPQFWLVTGGGGADTLVDSCSAGCGFPMHGGAGNDTLQGRSIDGGAGDDTLTGGPRRDSIVGGGGNDTLSGAKANDDLTPGRGDDTVDGGAGLDIVGFSSHPPTGVTADLRTGVATGDGTDTLTNVEGLLGSEEDDHLSGDSSANRFDGFGGGDVILGRAGADKLSECCSGSGSDHLYGGPGRDRLSGGDGDDFLRGGTGKDVLHGQLGDDRLSAKDGFRDDVFGGRGFDRARVDRGLDLLDDVERVFF
jgi:Ca2+-binding RTX toxin-like protein